MRDHTQQNQKSFERKSIVEKLSLRDLSVGQNVFDDELTQQES